MSVFTQSTTGEASFTVSCGDYYQYFNLSLGYTITNQDLLNAYVCGSKGLYNSNDTSFYTETNTTYTFDCGTNSTVTFSKYNISGNDLNTALDCAPTNSTTSTTSTKSSGASTNTVPNKLGLFYSALVFGGYLFSSI